MGVREGEVLDCLKLNFKKKKKKKRAPQNNNHQTPKFNLAEESCIGKVITSFFCQRTSLSDGHGQVKSRTSSLSIAVS